MRLANEIQLVIELLFYFCIPLHSFRQQDLFPPVRTRAPLPAFGGVAAGAATSCAGGAGAGGASAGAANAGSADVGGFFQA